MVKYENVELVDRINEARTASGNAFSSQQRHAVEWRKTIYFRKRIDKIVRCSCHNWCSCSRCRSRSIILWVIQPIATLSSVHRIGEMVSLVPPLIAALLHSVSTTTHMSRENMKHVANIHRNSGRRKIIFLRLALAGVSIKQTCARTQSHVERIMWAKIRSVSNDCDDDDVVLSFFITSSPVCTVFSDMHGQRPLQNQIRNECVIDQCYNDDDDTFDFHVNRRFTHDAKRKFPFLPHNKSIPCLFVFRVRTPFQTDATKAW